MKRLVALGVAASSVFLLPGTAWAAHGIIQDISVDETATLVDGTVRVTGTITCTTAATAARWRVGARVTQDGDTSRGGPDTGTCNGTPQPWRVFVSPGAGDDFEAGQAQVLASAQTGDNTPMVIDRAETTESVIIE
jgi:hypothetical protein